MTEPMAPPEPILVPGELRAYRGWMFSADWNGNRRLRSVSYSNNMLHPERRTHTARCEFRDPYRTLTRSHPVTETGEPAPVPADNCTCGFYGVVAGGLFATYGRSVGLKAGVADPHFMAGSVLLSGRIILGNRAIVRAEHMRLESLFGLAPEMIGGLRENLDAASTMYGVPAFSDPVDFEQRFPMPDLSNIWPDARMHELVTAQSGSEMATIKQELHEQNYDTDKCACIDCYDRLVQHLEQQRRNLELQKLMAMSDAAFFRNNAFWSLVEGNSGRLPPTKEK